MLGAEQLRALAAAARLGSDIIELTSRAGVQIRGLPHSADRTPEAAEAAEAAEAVGTSGTAVEVERVLAAGGLLPSRTHDRVRNVLASPLGGRHPAALALTDAVVVDLDRLICGDAGLANLPGRFIFEVDDASGIGRIGAADLTLRAISRTAAGEDRFQLVVGGVPTDLIRSSSGAGRLGVAAANAFLDLRTELGRDARHVVDLAGGPGAIAGRLGGAVRRLDDAPTDADPSRRRPSTLGVSSQPDGRRAVAGLARLGRLDHRQLDGLAELCTGSAGIRLSPWKTITVVDVEADASRATLSALADLGLVVSAGSRWVGLSACAGSGGCASSRIDVRGLAASRVAGRRIGGTEHWSGCERRCGEPAGAGVRVAPDADGISVRVDRRESIVGSPADALSFLAASGR
jgi:sulfite reductase beta subunit-like hemoprotein